MNTNRTITSIYFKWNGFVLCAFAIFILLGCEMGRLDVPATVPVRGVVTLKGKPARGVRVTLHRQDSSNENRFLPTGDTGPDGKFTLSTGAPLNGAPPGSYRVTFERLVLDPKNSVETEIDAFRGKFSDPAKSKWNVIVKTSETFLEPFELE